MATILRPSPSPLRVTGTPTPDDSDFGTLADLCLSHRIGERPELFGEFRPMCLVAKAQPTNGAGSLDKMSLSRAH